MADRCTLHFSKIDDFAAWAATKGWVREPTPEASVYEVLRLRKAGKPHPAIYYTKANATQHASARDGAATGLVRSYTREKRAGLWPLPEPPDA